MNGKLNFEEIWQQVKVRIGLEKPATSGPTKRKGTGPLAPPKARTGALAAPKKKTGALDQMLDGVKRAVGVGETPQDWPKKESLLALGTLTLGKDARKKVAACDRNMDGYVTMQELSSALKIPDLDDESRRVLKAAVAELNDDITALYTEALEHFNKSRDELNKLHHQGFEHFQIPDLLERAEKIEQVLAKLVAMLKSKPESMGIVRTELRDFIKDVRNLTKT